MSQIEQLLLHDSGLRGMSDRSGDMRQLLGNTDPAASQAVDVFVHRCTQAIGAMAATLGGVDALVFSGGIGAHSPAVRTMICAPLAFVGIALDAAANARNDESIGCMHVPVYALKTDEERVLAAHAQQLLARPRMAARGSGSDCTSNAELVNLA